MSKTFSRIVHEAVASVRGETADAIAPRIGLAWSVLLRHAHTAIAFHSDLVPSDELVSRVVDAVRAELAAEEAAPDEPETTEQVDRALGIGEPDPDPERTARLVRDFLAPPRSGPGGA